MSQPYKNSIPTLSLVSRKRIASVSISCCLLLASGLASAQEPPQKVTFDDHVKPLLVQRCSSCHNGQKREGDLDVTNFTNLMQGGGSGSVIEPQDSAGSYLYQLITHEESPEMPPSGTKIPDGEIQMIAKWIDLGALESKSSKAAKAKPKFDMAMSANPTARPDSIPLPLKMPIEPVIKTARPSVLAIATSPWAPIAAVAAPKQILLYHTQSLELLGVLPMEEGVAHSLRFSRNGQLLLAGGGRDGAKGTAVLFNAITGERITSVGDELETVLAADISPNHELVAIGGPSKLVKILSTGDGSLVAEIKKHTDWVTAIEFSPDGKFLATGDRNGGLQIWEADTGNEVFTLKGHTKSITGISWRADSQIACSSSEDTTLRIWELKKGTQLKSWGAHGGGATSLEFQRDGNIVSCGRDKVAKVWDQAGKMLKQFNGLTDVAVAVSFCDESNRVLAADWTGKLQVWNAADAVHIGNLESNPPMLAARLAASQTTLTAANSKYQPLQLQVANTKLALDGVGKSLEESKQSQVQLQAKLSADEMQFAAGQKQFESTNAQHLQWRSELDEKAAAKPLISELLKNADAAHKSLPNDPELKATLATLQKKIVQIDARVSELGGLVAKSDQEKITSKAQMDEIAKSVATTKEEMQAITAQVSKLQGEFGAMTEKLKTESDAAAAAQSEIQAATQLVQKWTSSIAFIADLNSLENQLVETRSTIAAKQAVVDQAQQKFIEAQQVVDEAKKQKSDAVEKSETLKVQLMKLRGAK